MDDDKAEAPSDLLLRADVLRDARRWEEAALAYARYLCEAPGDHNIRVQYGHCLKESGDPAAALAAYREAAALAPHDADIALQIGHALKLLGDFEGAWQAYTHALALDPAGEAAAVEVSALAPHVAPLRRAIAPHRPGQARQVVFDASDLIEFFRGARAPTGIQRVQLNIIAQALLDPPDDRGLAVVAFETHAGFWREIPHELFLRFWRLSRIGGDIRDPEWKGAVDVAIRAMRDGRDFAFVPGATLVNLGTSWWIKDYFLRVRRAKRLYGIRYIPFLHDCIPLLVPEHCDRALVREFAQWYAELARHADAAFANSESTARDATRTLGRLVPGLGLPITVVRLDASLREDLAGTTAVAAGPDIPGESEPFVLCVGTIESRKNHLLLFRAWLTLIRRHGAARIPPLLCVGKPGWLAQPALTLLDAAPELAGRVRILHGIPDIDLARLYERCQFTVYGSFHEGWGLPVTESLSYGKVPVVPRHSALVESGAGGALFFEHQNEPDLVAKLEAMILDPAFRAAREAEAAAVPLRRWQDLAAQILSDPVLVDRAAAIPMERRITMREGGPVALALSGASQPDPAMALAEALRDGLGWYPLEAEGCWTKPGAARLRLVLPSDTQGTFRVHLGLRAPAGGSVIGIRALPPDGSPVPFVRLRVPPRAALAVSLAAEAWDGEILVELEAPPRTQRLGRQRLSLRRVGICVTVVMACREGDVAARTAFLERQHLARIEAV